MADCLAENEPTGLCVIGKDPRLISVHSDPGHLEPCQRPAGQFQLNGSTVFTSHVPWGGCLQAERAGPLLLDPSLHRALACSRHALNRCAPPDAHLTHTNTHATYHPHLAILLLGMQSLTWRFLISASSDYNKDSSISK